jgi:RNA polymerase sigma factor (sigma-70 family)
VADVYRYALAILRNPSDAEDVTQTTFLNAYRAYRGGERPRAARSWLLTIAHNVCRQRFRELRRRGDEVELDETATLSPAPEETAPTAEDIRRALTNLRFTQRSALVMRELEGRSYAEIGEVLGLSTSAVETLIFRARRALREQLEGTLTCAEAERAISRQLDRRLGRPEQRLLRAHLRECPDCASLARRERARRTALRGLGAIPLPHSLASFFGGGAAGGGIAAKAATVVAAGALVGGASYEAVEQVRPQPAGAGAVPVAASPPPAAAVPVAVRFASYAPAPRASAKPTGAVLAPRREQHVTIVRPAAKPKRPRVHPTRRAAPPVAPAPPPVAPPPAPEPAPPAVVAAAEPPSAPSPPAAAEPPGPPDRPDAPGQTKEKERERPLPAAQPAPSPSEPGKGKAKGKAKAEERAAQPPLTSPAPAASPQADAETPAGEHVPPGQARQEERARAKAEKQAEKEAKAEGAAEPEPPPAAPAAEPPPAADPAPPPAGGPPETPPGQERDKKKS